ncbi:MAG TPA: hypothetical protein VJ810_36565 [Blastocatellia bacterium]|nr:hypothetical protein [Blastocatellia bacterium]
MRSCEPSYFEKLKWSLPWLSRYPIWRAGELTRRTFGAISVAGAAHLILVVANHFEPAWDEKYGMVDLATQLSRVEEWCDQARAIGMAARDSDGTPFRHTYFYPGEQYHRPLLDRLAKLEADGFGEVEIHLHHGMERPDTAENLQRSLEEFRDTLAEEHQCLSRLDGEGQPRYAFVHGNLALANSMGGRCCGVDSEMRILADTGCYADLTLPAAPLQPQTPRINALYQCGRPLNERMPHWTGKNLRVGAEVTLPILLTGPLVFDWSRRRSGLPAPRIDDGVVKTGYPITPMRLRRWRGAGISVSGRPEWIFIKLYCHGFFTNDQAVTIGEPALRFLQETLEQVDRDGRLKVHFATAREAFNIALAAVDGRSGEPNQYRNYRLRPIRRTSAPQPRNKHRDTNVEAMRREGEYERCI